jgi:hypothetical protein
MIACIVKVLGIYKVELVDLEVFRRVWVSCVCVRFAESYSLSFVGP